MSETRKEPAKHALYVTEEQVGALRNVLREDYRVADVAPLDSLLHDQVEPLYRSIHGPEE